MLHRKVRRILSIAVLLLLAAPLLAPFLAFASTSPSGPDLPACCRRLGAHHCAMSSSERARLVKSGPRTLTAPVQPCPFRSVQPAPAPPLPYMPEPANTDSFPGLATHANSPAQAEAGYRIARDRARQKRGPPARA